MLRKINTFAIIVFTMCTFIKSEANADCAKKCMDKALECLKKCLENFNPSSGPCCGERCHEKLGECYTDNNCKVSDECMLGQGSKKK